MIRRSELEPEVLPAYYNRGYVKFDLGQYQEALVDYDQAIELDPNSSLAYNNRGYAKANLGQYQEALTDYDQAIELDPNFLPRLLESGQCQA